jgi:hypothetical protein
MKTSLIVIISILICITSSSLLSQNSNKLEINGIVLDGKTKEPLSYALIGIKNKPIATKKPLKPYLMF